MTEDSRKSRSRIDRRSLLKAAAVSATAPLTAAVAQTGDASQAVPNRLKAVAVNFQPVLGDNAATAAKMKGIIQGVVRDGADLIVFPEMALQGFERCADCRARGGACDRHLASAERADGPLMRDLADVVKRHNMYAVIGFGERNPERPVIHNAAAMLGPEGLIGVTRKMGLGRSGGGQVASEDMFAQGDAITVYPTRYGPIGVGICYDIWINPEIARIMVLKGAKILAVPTATVATTIGSDIESMAFTRARENMVFVVNANLVRGGFEERDAGAQAKYYSHSYIAGPEFPRMARILGRTDDPFGLVSAEIDLSHYDRFALRSQLRNKRLASGLNAHISRIVAKEYAAYVGMTIT